MAVGATQSGDGTKSVVKIMANIFISFIGSGVLGLPYAFKEAGILEGILVISFVAIVSVKAMLLVIDCKYALTQKPDAEKLKKKHTGNREEMEDLIGGLSNDVEYKEIKPMAEPGADLSYGDVGFHAFGNFGRVLVEWAIILSQTGFCCAYLLFITSNLSAYIPSVPKSYWLLGLLPLEFGLCLFRNLKKLAVTSLFAQISNLMAFGVVFWFDFDEFHKIKHTVHPKEFSIEGLPFFLCVAIYCYEGAGMILSLEASLHKDIRHKFRRYFLTVITIVTILYATFGSCGYLSFGSDTQDIITLNLPKSEGGLDFATFVTSCLCLSLFFTYPIMMFPVFSILDGKMGVTKDNPKTILANFMRMLLVICTGAIVMIIPDFGNLMAFIGATCCIWLAFILPAVFHMKICARTMSSLDKVIDYVIIGMGIVGTIVGMIDAIRRMSGELDTTTKDEIASAVTVSSNSAVGSTVCDDPLRCVTEKPIEELVDSVIKTTVKKVTEIIANNITTNVEPS